MSLSKMLQEYREGLRGLPTYDELAAIANTEPCADPIVERNVSLLRERSTVGVQKYGTTLADNKLPLRAWLNHALEEALDQANYLQAAMAEIDSAAAHQIADASKDAELFGIDYLIDGVRVDPSRVTVLRPASTAKDQEPINWQEIALYYQNLYSKEKYRAPVRPVDMPDFLGKAFVTLESDGGRYSIVMKFNQKSDAFAAHDFLLRAGGKDYNGTAPAAHGDAKDAERWRFMMASVDSEDSQEALLLKKFGNEDFTDDKSESAQMTALVDAAIAAKAESNPQ